MIKHFLKISFRHIRRHKGYTFINITGLAIGIAVCLIIFLWIQGELSNDRFHQNAKDLYRVIQKSRQGGKILHISRTPPALGPYLKEQYPDILHSSRYLQNILRISSEKSYFKEAVAFVDESFLEMFSYPLIEGNPKTALMELPSIIISEEMRDKYFLTEDPVGKTLRIGKGIDLTVTGVFRDTNKNSHIKFDCLVPFKLIDSSGTDLNAWNSFDYITYVQLDKNISFSEVEAKISHLISTNVPGMDNILHLQPLLRIHLFALGGGGLITYIFIFGGMAAFILLIACINYINLSTARSSKYGLEVGIRRVVGANRPQLIKQFMGESILFSFIALIIGLMLVHLLLPTFSQLTGKPLSITYSPGFILILLSLALFTGLVSGIHPAFVLSAYLPIQVMQGFFNSKGAGAVLRKILVVAQFSISIFLITATLFVYRQLDFLMKKDLGYNKDNIIVLPMDNSLAEVFDVFKEELLKNSKIVSLTRNNTPPDIKQSFISSPHFSWDGRQEDDSFSGINIMGVDADYLKTFNMEMAQGRFFSDEFPTDWTDSSVINETAAAAMGLESPLGKRVYWKDFKGKIIGVIKDFHFSSLHDEIEPLVLKMGLWLDNICIRISPEDLSETIAFIESTTKELIPNYTLEFQFLDDRLASRYRSEKQMEKILIFSAVMAIFISCLGLLGLASFTAEQRTKEIAIRKILGSSTPEIMSRLSRDFLIWILFASLIAWPLAYLAVQKWIQKFASRIKIDWEIFLFSTFLALVISFLTVCYQAFKAASANPVKSLRYE